MQGCVLGPTEVRGAIELLSTTALGGSAVSTYGVLQMQDARATGGAASASATHGLHRPRQQGLSGQSYPMPRPPVDHIVDDLPVA